MHGFFEIVLHLVARVLNSPVSALVAGAGSVAESIQAIFVRERACGEHRIHLFCCEQKKQPISVHLVHNLKRSE